MTKTIKIESPKTVSLSKQIYDIYYNTIYYNQKSKPI